MVSASAPNVIVEVPPPNVVIRAGAPAECLERECLLRAAVQLHFYLVQKPLHHAFRPLLRVSGERGVIRWRTWLDSATEPVRGATLMRLRAGLIVESLGYVKNA